MVPLRLRLRNFLSYGEHAEPLDFTQFHVACLSGANGQGKSALLDAITWALWGEARKSAEARKPDEELLRVGAREMEVDLEFELEGARYRVQRGYTRSASGRTSRPSLEFHVWDESAASWRALTGTSLARTQEAITRVLGLDYDTFVNSAFLLQGRSDEFTKKKPTERKRILAQILGLDRFDRLQRAASTRATEADARCKALSAEIERLRGELADEAEVRVQHEAARAEQAARTRDLEQARAEVAEAMRRLAELEALAQRATLLRDQLRAAEETARERRLETERLGEQIDQAGALLAEADRIQADYQRHEELSKRLEALEEQRNQATGLQEQIRRLEEQRRLAAQTRRDRLARLEAEIESRRRELNEKLPSCVEIAPTRRALEEAREAERRSQALRDRLAELRARRERVRTVDERLARARVALEARRAELTRRIEELERQAMRTKDLPTVREAHAQAEAHLQDRQRELEEVRTRGLERKAAIEALEREEARLRDEIAAVDARRARLDDLETETCPTCGTRLTESHRAAVRQTFEEERQALESRVEALRAERATLEREREALRRHFAELGAAVQKAQQVLEMRARLLQELQQVERAADELRVLRDEHASLCADLEAERFEPELRAERQRLVRELEAEAVDEAALERARDEALREAAQGRALEQRLRDLEATAARVDALRSLLARDEAEVATLRKELDATQDDPLAARIVDLQRRLEALGYDPAHHDRLRREREGVREAPARYHDLLRARERVVEWKELRQRYADEAARAEEQARGHRAELERLDRALTEREAVARRHEAAARAAQEAERALHEAERQRAALEERLARCARDREALDRARAEHREARRQRDVWRRLRTAFGKNGIPALIIEDTLPELEARANELLDRLSGGRTRLHLETLRDTRTGGTRETLDIRITDEQGVSRAYETFSGGEAFRVNFALRIALAQLLAARAGVRIRTLVVDEGFGTQDKQGIEAIVGAIQTIRDDFEKVLVITHLDELKEAFPVRIEVYKHPVEGSRYDVIGV